MRTSTTARILPWASLGVKSVLFPLVNRLTSGPSSDTATCTEDTEPPSDAASLIKESYDLLMEHLRREYPSFPQDLELDLSLWDFTSKYRAKRMRRKWRGTR